MGLASGVQTVPGVTVPWEGKVGLRVTCSSMMQLLREGGVAIVCVLYVPIGPESMHFSQMPLQADLALKAFFWIFLSV